MDGSNYVDDMSVVALLSGLMRHEGGLTVATLEPVARQLATYFSDAPEQVAVAFAKFDGLTVVYRESGWYRFMGRGAFEFTFAYNGHTITHIVHM